jgi:3'-5' exoribonuclease
MRNNQARVERIPAFHAGSIKNPADALVQLRNVNDWVKDTELRVLNRSVLDDPTFFTSPGGATKHHDYEHGLVIHVEEVMQNVLKMTQFNPSCELATAVIWHDYMKTADYGLDAENKVVKLPYRKMIGHLPGSAMEFHRQAYGKIPLGQLERIEHLLLSHHGRREWGSPVEPATAEAFILHAADMMSAHGVNL